MRAALRALLNGFIDYAGLFPPAKLPLDQAFANFLRYRREKDAWMLRTFVCPVDRLHELVPMLDDGPPVPLAVLGKGGATPREYLENFQTDLHALRALPEKKFTVHSYELKMPDYLLDWPQVHIKTMFDGSSALFSMAGRPEVHIFVEAKFKRFQDLAPLIENMHDQHLSGYKLRCGGASGADIPAPEVVAFTLSLCQSSKVPMKFTAGLHHPFRHHNQGLNAQLHGFLNVYVACVLAQARKLELPVIEKIVADEDKSHFQFDDDGLAWQDVRASVREVETARKTFVTTLGSCSFDEPREDLRALGWL
ncbi:MAG: hypothetical protein AB7K24_11450 [Gemmataceae bacterium]